MKKVQTTLLYVVKNGKILLAEKLRGFGIGKINGVGGKLEAGETIEEAMMRETFEEIGIVPKNFEKFAEIDFFETVKGNRENVNMHVFVAKDYDGIETQSDEMRPVWCDLEKIPYEKMFGDDEIWLPLVLQNKKVKGHFNFDENFKILDYNVEEIESFN